jgi:uncharacterized membrane protein HdeD (DUF308 family)
LIQEADHVRKDWGWVLALGCLQIVPGLLAVSFAVTSTFASVVTFGVLLLIAAAIQVGAAICAREWKGFFLLLLLGILYAVAGFVTLFHPIAAAEGLTLMLAAAFLVGGVFRIVVAVVERFASWVWVLLNGVVTVLLVIAICRQWPVSGLWVLGMFVGIELVVNGLTLSVLAVTVRKALPGSTGN